MAPMIKGNLYWHWPQIMRTDGDRNVLLIKATNNGKNDLLSGIVVASSVFTLAHNYGLNSSTAQDFRSFFDYKFLWTDAKAHYLIQDLFRRTVD